VAPPPCEVRIAIAQLGAAPAEELLAWARRLHANSPASGGLVLVTALLGQASAELFLPTADEAGARDLAQRLRQSEPGNASVIAPGEPTLSLTVTHPDLDTLRQAHATIVARLQADGRVLGPYEGPRTAPELRIQLRPAVHPGEPRPTDLPQALQALTGTLEVADLYEGARRLPVRLRLGPELSPQQMADVVLPLTRGPTRLADLANITWEETPAHILRVDGRRAARITVIGASKTLPTLEAELIPAWKGAFPGLEVRIQNGV
jgi:multidrug efflux pump subunit AcrB